MDFQKKKIFREVYAQRTYRADVAFVPDQNPRQIGRLIFVGQGLVRRSGVTIQSDMRIDMRHVVVQKPQ